MFAECQLSSPAISLSILKCGKIKEVEPEQLRSLNVFPLRAIKNTFLVLSVGQIYGSYFFWGLAAVKMLIATYQISLWSLSLCYPKCEEGCPVFFVWFFLLYFVVCFCIFCCFWSRHRLAMCCHGVFHFPAAQHKHTGLGGGRKTTQTNTKTPENSKKSWPQVVNNFTWRPFVTGFFFCLGFLWFCLSG